MSTLLADEIDDIGTMPPKSGEFEALKGENELLKRDVEYWKRKANNMEAELYRQRINSKGLVTDTVVERVDIRKSNFDTVMRH